MASICIGPPILKMPPSVLLGPLRDFTEKKMIIKNHESHVQSVLENVKEDFFFFSSSVVPSPPQLMSSTNFWSLCFMKLPYLEMNYTFFLNLCFYQDFGGL